MEVVTQVKIVTFFFEWSILHDLSYGKEGKEDTMFCIATVSIK